ncbi:helix-turn-helix domain-containing protein [Nocardiopsis sp. NPDC101807]|uniref:helix-turn-helix domain-containing protein n=1 Tax=Nocardiopsis sp. NPDC101807 TaxID=3364339 RepID=UPI00380CD820
MTTVDDHVPYPVVLRAPDVDWIKFDAELARDGSVEPVVKALYAALASFADQTSRDTDENPDDDDIPTRKRLAACIGKSVDTVDRGVKKLEEYGLLEVERRKDPANPRSNIPSVYRLLDRERWDERAGERAAKRRAERAAKRAEAAEKAAAKSETADQDTCECEQGGVAAPMRPGWPHRCGQGGRTHAATWPHPCGGTSSSQEKSSSSGSAGVTPSPRVPADEEDDTSSTNTKGRQPGAVDLVREMTDATEDEAAAVLERVKADYKAHHGRSVRSVRRYVSGFDIEDLTPHLDAVRAQRASEARAEANETAGVDTRCHTHHEPMPCAACRFAPKPVLVSLLKKYGAARRPDIAQRLDELVGAR